MLAPIYIALEGLDGSGKTTQARRLAETLAALGRPTYITAEPSELPIGLLIRRALRGEITADEVWMALLFAADRVDLQRREILPRLARGYAVVSDRCFLSSLAYQSLNDTLEPGWLREINRHVRPPDLIVYLDLSPERAQARVESRSGPSERYEGAAHQAKIRARFSRAIAFLRQEDQRIVEVNADGEEAEVASAILAAVKPLLTAPARP